jgi:hypothetical protein
MSIRTRACRRETLFESIQTSESLPGEDVLPSEGDFRWPQRRRKIWSPCGTGALADRDAAREA